MSEGQSPPFRLGLKGWVVAAWCCLLALPTAGQEEGTRNGDGRRASFGENISLSLREADLAETLRSFAQLGKFNLILDPSISGKITVELKDVPWDQALKQILKVHGLGMEISGGQLLIAPPQAIEWARAARQRRLAAIRTVRLELKYAGAAAVAACLEQEEAAILTHGGTAEAERESNALVLRDRASRLLKIGRLLVRLDLPEAAEEDPDHLIARCRRQWAELGSL